MSSPTDWRVKLLGDWIQPNKEATDSDDDTPVTLVPTTEALEGYDYLALFFGSRDCSHCMNFAFRIIDATDAFEKNKCKPLFISYDRDEVAFDSSYKKVFGIDAMAFDKARARKMRHVFGLNQDNIPALVILENDNFSKEKPTVINADAHLNLEYDPELKAFPWTPTEKSAGTMTNDWHISFLGDWIRPNTQTTVSDEEAPITLVPMAEALKGYDYLALFFGTDYCPYCKKFAPHVVAAADNFKKQSCKPLFISNDRDDEAFENSCKKVFGIDVMAYNTARTRQMRDLFGLDTIPALIILKNDNFSKETPTVITNGRRTLEYDPQLNNFPWGIETSMHGGEKKKALTNWERFWIHGNNGKWYQFGHTNVPGTQHPKKMYMDEQAVRIRAGMLNAITWIALMNVFFWTEQTIVKVFFPLVAFEFIASMLFGLTPFAPIGTLATLVSLVLHPEPTWKPAAPKRFAWLIGLVLATSCFVVFLLRKEIGPPYYRPTVATIVMLCNIATWLEGSCGFCIGCFIYNHLIVKWFSGFEQCSECKI